MKLLSAEMIRVFCWIIFFPGLGSGQTPIGQIEPTNYSRIQYGAGTQNWSLAQDAFHRIYVANNEGLLVYDGTNWQQYPVPNKTILRSIAFGKEGKLYAGAQNEFGYYEPDKIGRLHFISLKGFLPKSDKTFADVWNIQVVNKGVFFRTNDKIIRLSDNKISVYHPASSWLSMCRYNDQLMAQDDKKGLLIFQDSGWQTLIEKSILPQNFIITDIIQYNKDTSLLSTTKNGLFLLSQNKLHPFSLKNNLSDQNFTSLVSLDQNSFFAGTYSNGIYHIDRNGNILENINSKNGLQNNTVRCLYADIGGNLWTGLDNGISFFALNNAIKHINPQAFNNGGGYGVKILNGQIYFALSTGLQWLPLTTTTDLSSSAREPQRILEGQTWNLSVIKNQILVGRDDGFWQISNNKATPVSSTSGYWNYQLISETSPTQIAAGNYTGIRLFQEKSGNFIDKGEIQNFNESSRFVETDNKNIWISHPYRGVYKISLATNAISFYCSKNGLPADLDNYVFKIKNKIVFATSKGIYEYNAAEDKMIPAKQYASLFGELSVRYLKEDGYGNIWFVHEKMLGVADNSIAKPAIYYIPELKNKIMSGFENIYPYNNQNVFIGSENGFYHINYEKYKQNIRALKPYITTVQITGSGDSILFGGYTFSQNEKKEPISITYKSNSLRFTYAASSYGQESAEYSYYLQGFDKNWSTWSNRAEKDYTNLPEGTYSFAIKARTGPTSLESEVYTYNFSVTPPWYRTLWANMAFSFLFFLLLYTLFKYQEKKLLQKQEERRIADQKKFEEEQRQLGYQYQLELEKSEKEMMRLRNENLEAEIEFKNAELAGIAMSLVQKKEFLLKITDELNKLNKSGKERIETAELKKVLRSLTSEEKLDEEWKQFSVHFNNVHNNFLINLKDKHPNLNAHELKLCAYLRMNLTSKEMAQLMSISVRGVEINRYRLRKKLLLQPKEDLFQYLLYLDSLNKSKMGNDTV